MPRRNRNAGTPRPDADQLAADLDQLAADLCPGLPAGHGTGTMLLRYLARTITPRPAPAMTAASQPIPQLTAQSG
jgi:hypothetical protein